MEFIDRLTEAGDIDGILADLLNDVSGTFDFGVLFVSPWQPYDPTLLYNALKDRVEVRHLLCCTCAGVIARDKEIEGHPAASLMLARLPGVAINPFSMTQATLEQMNEPNDWLNFFEVYPNEKPAFIVFPDPFLIDINRFLANINRVYPGAPVVGGLPSAASGPRENTMILDGDAFAEGIIGVCLRGNVQVETVVSQGCRAVGETFIITRGERNIIYELAGQPFYKVLEDVLKQGTEYDRHMAREGVLIGIAISEYKDEFRRGDFLIRAVVSADPETGAGLVGDHIYPGQTVQFHIRDAKTADEDLHALLNQYSKRPQARKPEGALVFSCNGRGRHMFGDNNHDINVIKQYVGGDVPAAGFFCAGEIGPIGGKNFLHGFTNSMALFYPARSMKE